MKRKKNCKRICVLLMTGLLISSTPSIDVLAANNQRLYNYTTKSTMNVSDTKITYKYNGKTISLPGTPGILSSNNVALGPYVLIMNKKMGIKTKYDKANKTVTFKKDNTTVVLTLGSKTAVVNGKKVTMNAAPICVKYRESGKTAILVPTRFISETFGFYYEWNSATSTVSIKESQKLQYDNTTVNYTGVLGKVTLDGVNINVSNMPTILLNNTAMIQAYRVFNNKLEVKYRYYPSSGKLIFVKGDIKLEMQLGSSIVTINGILADCGTSPKLIKNLTTGVETVMVPAQFVSKALGYDYAWNNETKTSQIMTSNLVGVRPNLVISSGSSTGGSNGSYKEVEYFRWGLTDQYKLSVQQAKAALANSKNLVLNSGSNSTLSSIKETVISSELEAIQMQFSNKLDSVSATHEGNQVTISLKNTFATEQILNCSKELIEDVSVKYDTDNLETNVVVTLKGDSANYELIPSEDNLSLTVNFYPNYITEVVAGQDSNGYQYISFQGLSALKPIVTESDKNIYVQFNNTMNGVGDQIFVSDMLDKDMIDNVILESPSLNSSIFMIEKPNSESTYTMHEDGTTLSFYIDRKDKIPVINDSPIEIQLPEGISASSITDKDLYNLKQFQILIPGDHRSFYNANPIINSYSDVANIKVSYNASNQTVITVNTNVVQGYKYELKDGILVLTVDSPSKIYDRIVVLDAGHGGKDPGAVYGSAREKVINFNVLNVYAKSHFENAGIKVYYTRQDDTLIALADRASFASQVEADLFISLHCNAASNTSAKGTSVYYSSTNKAKTPSGLTSKILATNLVNTLSSNLGTKNLGTIDKGFVVVRDNTVPAVLVELAFLSNPSDKEKLISASFQKKAAQTICDSVISVFKSYPTKR